jgi:ribosomal protein S19E (S16A)
MFEELESEGLISRVGDQLTVTPEGRYKLNEHWEEAISQQRPFSLLG